MEQAATACKAYLCGINAMTKCDQTWVDTEDLVKQRNLGPT
jgi:hypothetical protein